MYRFADPPGDGSRRAAILFSGPAQGAARWARDELWERYGIGAELWSVTSFGMLREDALSAERWNRLHPGLPPRAPLVARNLAGVEGPVAAVTDYMRLVPDQVARWVAQPYISLGADGFGRSDTRESLRRFFEVDGPHLTVAVLSELAKSGEMDPSAVSEAMDRYGIDPEAVDPWRADD